MTNGQHGPHARADWLASEDIVQMLLSTMHEDCTEGFGFTADSCSARRELLEARRENNWSFPVPPGERQAS